MSLKIHFCFLSSASNWSRITSSTFGSATMFGIEMIPRHVWKEIHCSDSLTSIISVVHVIWPDPVAYRKNDLSNAISWTWSRRNLSRILLACWFSGEADQTSNLSIMRSVVTVFASEYMWAREEAVTCCQIALSSTDMNPERSEVMAQAGCCTNCYDAISPSTWSSWAACDILGYPSPANTHRRLVQLLTQKVSSAACPRNCLSKSLSTSDNVPISWLIKNVWSQQIPNNCNATCIGMQS